MRFHRERPSCGEVRDRIDDLIDGDTPDATLETHLAACPVCARELALARRLQEALAEGLPPLRCPEEVSEAVLALAARESAETTPRLASGERKSPGHRPPLTGGDGRTPKDRPAGTGTGRFAGLRDLFAGSVLRPAMAAVVVLLLVAAPVAVWRSFEKASHSTTAGTATDPAAGELDGYTAAEVARAEAEARRVLSYIASVSRDAGEAVRQEVFEERVVEPVRRLAETPSADGGDGGNGGPSGPSGEETP